MAEPEDTRVDGEPIGQGSASATGCPVMMAAFDYPPRCGRPLHPAPTGADVVPVCLMHSLDPAKQEGALKDEFWVNFEAILTAAGGGEADFRAFVFPAVDIQDRTFKASCRFDRARFPYGANFVGAMFQQGGDFSDAIFPVGADFSFAEFSVRAYFTGATFMGWLADFSNSVFTPSAGFGKVQFLGGARFVFTEFRDEAFFVGAIFHREADFSKATFTLAATFRESEFHTMANLAGSRFLAGAEFRRTVFAPEVNGDISAKFETVTFVEPGSVVFDDVDLSRALLHNCNVSEVWFTSSVRWGERGGHRGAQVFDEIVALDHQQAGTLLRNGERDYRAIAQIYQQLKKNYDARLDYWTANEFHYGEMEMQRLAAPTRRWLPGLRKWVHSRLSLVAWYRYASDYGNSYRKPLVWLLGVLLLFMVMFPLPGLQRSGTNSPESYGSVWRAGGSAGQRLKWEAGLLGKSLLASVDTAMFQKGPEYAPVYPWGRTLAVLEMLLTATLFGLFLLAIRRQFRR
jgi:uncharacterized protein YjbI with pentapeptide repeats